MKVLNKAVEFILVCVHMIKRSLICTLGTRDRDGGVPIPKGHSLPQNSLPLVHFLSYVFSHAEAKEHRKGRKKVPAADCWHAWLNQGEMGHCSNKHQGK